MPCMGPYSDREIASQAEEKNDKLSRMLCAVCKHLEKKDKQAIRKVRGLTTWWKKHKRLDEFREADEKAEKEAMAFRKKTLSKLTKEERWALGLDRGPRGTMR